MTDMTDKKQKVREQKNDLKIAPKTFSKTSVISVSSVMSKATKIITSDDLCEAAMGGENVAYENTLALLEACEWDADVVNGRSRGGNAALCLACIKCNTAQSSMSVVRLLLSVRGVDVNVRTKWGNTPLMAAALYCNRTSSMECVRLLLATEGIDVNARNNNGTTAAGWAAWQVDGYSSAVCLELLLLDARFDGCVYYDLPFPAQSFQVMARLLQREQLPRLHLRFDEHAEVPDSFPIAVASSTRLMAFSMTNWDDGYRDVLLESASIISTGEAEGVPEWMAQLCERNRKARAACVAATVVVCMYATTCGGRLFGRFVAEYVLSTIGERCWIR